MLTAPIVEQVLTGVPAFALGFGPNVSIFVALTLPQGAIPIAVSVNVTFPAVRSAALGL